MYAWDVVVVVQLLFAAAVVCECVCVRLGVWIWIANRACQMEMKLEMAARLRWERDDDVVLTSLYPQTHTHTQIIKPACGDGEVVAVKLNHTTTTAMMMTTNWTPTERRVLNTMGWDGNATHSLIEWRTNLPLKSDDSSLWKRQI